VVWEVSTPALAVRLAVVAAAVGSAGRREPGRPASAPSVAMAAPAVPEEPVGVEVKGATAETEETASSRRAARAG
jgi:hypothetical protein